jgi:hypothetical protein
MRVVVLIWIRLVDVGYALSLRTFAQKDVVVVF